MRAHEILTEDQDELVRNPNDLFYSIFKNVTAIGIDFERGRSDPWIAYVNVGNNSDLLDLVKEHGWARTGMGHETYLSIARFEDERDAAYVGQQIASDLEENIMRMLAGEDWESVVGQIPTWTGAAPDRNHSGRKTLPEYIPPTPRAFDTEKATNLILKLERGKDPIKFKINTNELSMSYNLNEILKVMEVLVIKQSINYNDAAQMAVILADQQKKK